MRTVVIAMLGLVFGNVTAQQLNINYRTATEGYEGLYYVVFLDKSNCRISFPMTTHVDAMFPRKRNFDMSYKVTNDTISFFSTNLDSTNSVVQRILLSKFVIVGKKKLVDIVNGYTYVDKTRVSDKHIVFAFNGKTYRQKTTYDGYGLALKVNKLNPRLRRRIKKSGEVNLSVTILRGKSAYEKYGLVGMNGVVEISSNK